MKAKTPKRNPVDMLEINLSNLCNLKCLTCVRNAPDYVQQKPTYLTLEQFKIIINRFPGLRKLQICGFSEPTLNPNLADMIRFAKSQGIKHVESFTNGTILKGTIVERLASSGLDLLRVSIDGGDAQTYKKVRGFDLNIVTDNIRAFTELSGIPVRMEAVLSKHTGQSAELFPNVAHSAGAKMLSVRLLDGQDYYLSKDFVYDKQYLQHLKQHLLKTCESLGIELIMSLPGDKDYVSACTAWKEVYVDEAGGLIPCYLLGTKPIGNLLEQSFEEICEHQEKLFWEQKESNGGFLPSCCCNWALVSQHKV